MRGVLVHAALKPLSLLPHCGSLGTITCESASLSIEAQTVGYQCHHVGLALLQPDNVEDAGDASAQAAVRRPPSRAASAARRGRYCRGHTALQLIIRSCLSMRRRSGRACRPTSWRTRQRQTAWRITWMPCLRPARSRLRGTAPAIMCATAWSCTTWPTPPRHWAWMRSQRCAAQGCTQMTPTCPKGCSTTWLTPPRP